jgi:hypothetical protein
VPAPIQMTDVGYAPGCNGRATLAGIGIERLSLMSVWEVGGD